MAEELKATQAQIDAVRDGYGHFTEEATEAMVQRQKKTVQIEDTLISDINADNLRRMARATGDQNKLFYDIEYGKTTRYGKCIAPDSLYYGVFWGSWDLRHGQGFPGVHGFHCGDRWVFYQPLYLGDKVRAEKQEWSLQEMVGKWAGRQMIQVTKVRFYNQKNELCAQDYFPNVRGERQAAEKKGKYVERKLGVYTKEDNLKFDEILRAQENGGDNGRTWESVNVGDETYTYLRGPMTVADFICWLEGVNSPHCRTGLYWLDYRTRSPKISIPHPETGIYEPVERVHWDSWLAREVGMPAAYDYGSMRGGWACMFAQNWAGDNGWLAEGEWQYRMMNFIGDVTQIKGTVTNKWVGKVSGTHYVDIEFHSMNQRGEDSMPGWVTIALPTAKEPLKFPIDAEADRGEDPTPTYYYGPKAVAKAKAKGTLIACEGVRP